MTHVMTNSLEAWLLAFRPKTLGAISCPVLLGSALAYAHGHWAPALMATTLLCSFMLQILANVVNDYGDFIKGGDTKERLGPPRAMQRGFITLSAMQKGMAVILLATISLGLILVYRGGLPILMIGILSIVLCIWYTIGPKPLAYLGFAEIAILFFFGPLPVMGAYYLQSQILTSELWFMSISPAFLSTALIMTNNLRDMKEDEKNNKRTLAVRFGASFSRLMITSLIIGAFSSPLILIIFYGYSWWLLGVGLALVPALKHLAILHEPIGARYNLLFVGIGKSLYGLSLLFGAGIIYGAP